MECGNNSSATTISDPAAPSSNGAQPDVKFLNGISIVTRCASAETNMNRSGYEAHCDVVLDVILPSAVSVIFRITRRRVGFSVFF